MFFFLFLVLFLVENKTFHLSKRALCAGTIRNKWLKKALATIMGILKLNRPPTYNLRTQPKNSPGTI